MSHFNEIITRSASTELTRNDRAIFVFAETEVTPECDAARRKRRARPRVTLIGTQKIWTE
jgi:hypothetical protein